MARALLSSYPIAGLEPLSKLSARASVSMPTVTRLLAKLDFDGYPAFQAALREEVHERISSPSNRYDSKLSSLPPAGLIASSFNRLQENLQSTGSGLSVADFDASVNLLADRRKRIRALGGRVSHVLATHLVNQLSDLRPGVELLPAGSSRLLGESLGIVRSDVVIAFDYKRYQNDTVMFARQAARRGATVIVVTDPFLSPAADVAAHVLTFSVVALPPFDSPIGGFAIVESLIAGVAVRLGEAGRTRIQQMEGLSTRWMWDEGLVDDSLGEGRDGAHEP